MGSESGGCLNCFTLSVNDGVVCLTTGLYVFLSIGQAVTCKLPFTSPHHTLSGSICPALQAYPSYSIRIADGHFDIHISALLDALS
jgi:hypothetical protein